MVIADLTVPAFGAAALGVFIGYIVWYFVVRLGGERYTTDGLVAVVGVLAGGVVMDFLKDSGLPARDRWWYPIGLLIGWALFVIFYFVNWLAKGRTAEREGGGPRHGPLPALLPPRFKL
jgi:hypothetical protein